MKGCDRVKYIAARMLSSCVHVTFQCRIFVQPIETRLHLPFIYFFLLILSRLFKELLSARMYTKLRSCHCNPTTMLGRCLHLSSERPEHRSTRYVGRRTLNSHTSRDPRTKRRKNSARMTRYAFKNHKRGQLRQEFRFERA